MKWNLNRSGVVAGLRVIVFDLNYRTVCVVVMQLVSLNWCHVNTIATVLCIEPEDFVGVKFLLPDCSCWQHIAHFWEKMLKFFSAVLPAPFPYLQIWTWDACRSGASLCSLLIIRLIVEIVLWVVGCWRGYLSGARCRLAYGPADATASHCLLLQ